MQVEFLDAGIPLTKTYAKSSAGVTKTPYPMTWEFTSIAETFTTLQQLEALLKSHAAQGHCLLKGSIARPLVKESRAGSTDSNATTEFIVLDLDGLPDTIDLVSPGGNTQTVPMTIDLFLAEMGLSDTSYIVQWSASYGILDKKIRAHVFMLLDRPHAAPLLKQWLIQKNHEVPLLRASMGLTKTNNSLRWPLDISACQNDKLIYIAPPTLKGIKDPMGKTPRISLVKKRNDKLTLSSAINTTTKNRELTIKRVDELREETGLPKRKHITKMVGTQEVLLKPDEAIITEMKVERGFVYFNLNGGDSWAYYHPEENPDYVHNFKGEPSYLTKELLPDYWQQLTGNGSSTRTSSSGLLYLAFCDRQTGVYWRGTYDQNSDVLDIVPAKNETQLRHFAKQYGVPMGDFVPEWDLVFDPHDMVRVDVQNRIVNKFQPTPYMLNVGTKMPKAIPKTILKVMDNALGSDPDVVLHFINWLGAVVQTRDRTRTAWVLHGTHGTGKGILTNNILKPLFGAHTATRRMEELNEKYNHFMEGSFLVFVDEVQTKALQNERGVMAKLKNFITESTVAIRAMYANATEVRNHTNWIFMSNMSDPISIDKEDRRFNVARYQPVKLSITDAELKQIEKELQPFYDYLANMTVDFDKAGQVIHNDDRNTMISISESSIDTVGSALLEGSFEFFLEQLPTDNSHQRNTQQNNRVLDYTELLKKLITRTLPNGVCNITREELRTLFDFTIGNVPQSPNKFTALLKHHRIHLDVVWMGGKSVRGMKVTWKDINQFPQYTSMFLTPPATPAAPTAPGAAPKPVAKRTKTPKAPATV
jgi:hypothetical protein